MYSKSISTSACVKSNGVCEACFYADFCPRYQSTGTDTAIITRTVNCASLSLCEGRHEIPDAKDGSIFPMSVDPVDTFSLYKHAVRMLLNLKRYGVEHVDLYVTGLTVALIEALNAARDINLPVTLYHYNRETGTYYPQEVK